MATLTRLLTMAALAGLVLSGCGKRVGLDTPVTPLAQIHFLVTGVPSVLGTDAGEQDASAVLGEDAGEQDASAEQGDARMQAPHLRVALVWGAQVLPEPFCVLPPESPAAAAVIQAGCPDIFRFVPNLSGPGVAVEPGVPGTIDLINLPKAGVMVGDLTARIAYASLVVYDDRNGNGILDFRHPQQGHQHEEDYDPGTPATRDIPYGASFISMTQPDQRVAYHEGGDFSAAFYPRPGCGQAPPNFSILSAGGFPRPDLSQDAALLALSLGQLPAEDPATCGVAKLDEAVVTVPLQLAPDRAQSWPPPDALKELACTVNNTDGTTRYREPPANAPDLAHLDWACVGFPHLPGDTAGVASGQQLVVAGAPNDPCQYVNHYTLRGCDNDPNCSAGFWDYTTPENPPPAWWPCPTTP
jgi:hypothetical protein